jgi:uncharacterized protein
MESLDDKLKSLGVSLGMGNLKPPKAPSPSTGFTYPVEKVVDGEEIATPFGNAFLITNSFKIDFQPDHDLIRPDQIASPFLNELMDLPGNSHKFIFLDTETSGLSGGSGTFAFLIGLGYFEKDYFSLSQIFMRHPQEEEAVLAALNQLVGDTNILVTFNGKSFDVPLLNTRHKIHGFSPIFQKDTHHHIDMLHIARKIWKDRLPSRALGDLEKQILNIYRTDEEVPGWMIPDLYFDYLASGDARPLKRVFYHNAMDIVSLALLFIYTNDILSQPLAQDIDSIDLAAIARIFENQNKIEDAVNLYAAAINQGLPADIYIQTVLRYARIYKQEKSWEKAVIFWKKAADVGSLDAAVELAKYYEHSVRNNTEAIHWVNYAIKINSSNMEHTWSTRLVEKDLQHRLNRLENKTKPDQD